MLPFDEIVSNFIGKENANILVSKTFAFTGMFIQEGMVRNVDIIIIKIIIKILY